MSISPDLPVIYYSASITEALDAVDTPEGVDEALEGDAGDHTSLTRDSQKAKNWRSDAAFLQTKLESEESFDSNQLENLQEIYQRLKLQLNSSSDFEGKAALQNQLNNMNMQLAQRQSLTAPTVLRTTPEPLSTRTVSPESGLDIANDQMTPEELFWHEFSKMFIEGYWGEGYKYFTEGLRGAPNKTSFYKDFFYLTNRYSLGDASREAAGTLLKKWDSLLTVIKIPEGVDMQVIMDMLNGIGVTNFKINSDNEFVISPIPFKEYDEIRDVILYAKDFYDKNPPSGTPVPRDIIEKLRSKLTVVEQFKDKYLKFFNAVKTCYPQPERPSADNSSIAGIIDGMMPAFKNIDKINNNFYKSLIDRIILWQGKINEFNTAFSKALKNGGFDSGKNYHWVLPDDLKEMRNILKKIEPLSEVVLALGGLSEASINKLLEGTGLETVQVTGTLVQVNIGNVFKELKKAIDNNFSDKATLTPESLAQFQKTLDQIQANFDSTTQKVNTMSGHNNSIFESTQEALSAIINEWRSLLADLMKNLR